MKQAKITFYIFLLLGLSLNSSFAQPNPILENFLISESNGKVLLNWQIKSGSTCNGIQIFRSTDSLNFYQIWDIQGVCGNISQAENYAYTDNEPVLNKINYYRLELGNAGFSPIVSIEVIDLSNGYQIRPNPVVSEFKIYFDNSKEQEHQLHIYSMSGAQVLNTHTKINFFQLDGSILQSGLFLFTISTEGNSPSVQGKLIIQK